jgi:hypothetical protein
VYLSKEIPLILKREYKILININFLFKRNIFLMHRNIFINDKNNDLKIDYFCNEYETMDNNL